MVRKSAHYVAIELKYGDRPGYHHIAYECETHEEAKEGLEILPKMYGEISRCIIAGPASGDCREHRPC